jgi:adenylate cyclase
MAKIYRAFVRAMVMCVYKSGGSVRQIVGDRFMGDFVNQEDKKATEKALDAARAILTTVDYYFNPECKKKVNGKQIQCGVGIDYGKVLLTQVGMKAEDEEAKDLVWAGKIANVASKHTDLAEQAEIFITKRFYDNLPANNKTDEIAWKSVVRLKGNTLFEGFVKENFYLDCISDEETPTENKETVMKNASFSVDDGLNVSEIINKIVHGTQKQTEQLLKRFETVIRREISLDERERILKDKERDIRLKEQSLSEQKKFLDSETAKINERTEFKKNEVEYNLRAEHLSNNINSFKFEKMLEELQSLIKLGEKIGKSHLDLKRHNYINGGSFLT